METTVTSDYKFAIVLSKKVEPGPAMNACAHMAACLVATADDETRKHMSFVEYVDATDVVHPVSGLSLIVLEAKNSNQLRTARNAAIAAGIACVDFTESMTKDSYVEQMERTRQISEFDLDYWGLGLFGPREDLEPITKKFSLRR